MVVPVFMISCQVSLKSKSGPDMAQRTNVAKAMVKAAGRPTARDGAGQSGEKGRILCHAHGDILREHRGIEPAIKTACFLEVITAACPGAAPFFCPTTKKAPPKSSLRSAPLRHTIPSI
jgi:hypothetical protein